MNEELPTDFFKPVASVWDVDEDGKLYLVNYYSKEQLLAAYELGKNRPKSNNYMIRPELTDITQSTVAITA